MAKLKGIISALLLVAIGIVFFYRANVLNYFSPKLQGFEDRAISAAVKGLAQVASSSKQVNAPPPLVAPKKTSPPSASAAQLIVSGTIKWTNIERKNNGNLPPLSEDMILDEIASLRLADMFKYQYFAHISPSGLDAEAGASRVGYDYIAIGENLALGDFTNDEDLVTAWMNSPGHRENILSMKYREIGVAVKKGMFDSHSQWLAVQIFGRPASSCPAVDDSLKTRIDSEEATLQDMQNNLQTLKAAIESMAPHTAEEYNSYNQKVGQYNALVSNYNAFLAQTKSDISEYNGEVAAFNQCLST